MVSYRHGNKRVYYGAGKVGTAAQLITPSPRARHANFNGILPRAMAQLVADGLFVKDKSVEGGYRITKFGLVKLKELENS